MLYSGEITFANGDEFYGELKQDAFHGNNCNYTWAQGHEIRGRFEDDMPKTGVFKSLGMDDLQFNFTK